MGGVREGLVYISTQNGRSSKKGEERKGREKKRAKYEYRDAMTTRLI